MKRKRRRNEDSRCKLVRMVIADAFCISDVTREVLDQFERLDDFERIVVVTYLQVTKREFLLVDKTKIFEFIVDTDKKVVSSDLFLLHKWLESIASKCRSFNDSIQLQVKEEICVEIFREKIVYFESQSSNKKRRS